MKFEVIGEMEQVETIAAGRERQSAILSSKDVRPWPVAEAEGHRYCAASKWKTSSGRATLYEAHGIGKRDFKIKDYLDKP